MNKTSIKFATWAVRVCYSHTFHYTYTSKKTQKPITSYKFECCLVGKLQTAYVRAVVKGTEKDVQTATAKFKDGSIWEVSKTQFEQNVATSIIGAPLKVSVDLSKSTMKALEDPDMDNHLAKAAVPPRSVADTSNITSTRHTDLMGVVTAIAPPRSTKRGDVVDVTLMDASEDTPGTYAKVIISVWGKPVILAVGKPLVFLNLACKVDADCKQFNHWEDSMLCGAPACDKNEELTKDFDKIKGATNTVTLTKFTPKSSVDVSGAQPLAVSAFLDFTSHNPTANLPSVMQIMYATLEEPTGSITPQGSDRIWFITKMRDVSGSSEVSVPERVALGLLGLDRAGFQDAHATGTLQFPLLCNLRVSRSASTGAFQPGGSDPGASDAKTFVNHVIQEATPIDWSLAAPPNAAYDNILAMLNLFPRHEEGVVFGYLSDISSDPHSGFRLTFENGTVSKGVAVAVLIAANKKSNKPEPMGQGYKIVTSDVCDVANPSGAAQPAGGRSTYNVTGFCTLEDMAKFDLNPPRGHSQRYGIAFITNCEDITQASASQPGIKSFHLDKLQILEQTEGPKAVLVFQRLRRLTMRLNPPSTEERKHTLDFAEEPAPMMKKCRTLCAVPTDKSLDEMVPGSIG